MFVLRLMGSCSNRCLFCMVREEMAMSSHMPFDEIEKKISHLKEGDAIDLFGGEPTLYPRFWDLMDLVAKRKLIIHLASNCRKMSKPDFMERLSAYPNLNIRTSYLGQNEEIHDYYTNVRGSYRDTVRGMKNVIACKVPLHVNIVIARKNFTALKSMVTQLIDLGVNEVKLSYLTGYDSIQQHLVKLDELRPKLVSAIEILIENGISLQIEKAPLCIAPQYINYHIPESHRGMAESLKRYLFTNTCKSCKLMKACIGVLPTYHHLFGESGVVPFDSIPPDAIRNVTREELDHYKPDHTTEFLSLQSNQDLDLQSHFTCVLKTMLKLKAYGHHSKYFVRDGVLIP